ncbi:GNAT family N-acetyltransferase [Aquincola tertiaricarbonis]|uniref:GNAT family N-acetyltransferase n=1 Tax=Aquincola tertiaricarbonis TaxID=391953 RepID=A0ABY4S5B2_AQUTE|nr:GNAT family N-acetyltransferase [Aquincola tertiaricarbonis]URI07425.1 GNAT family N-acetyltransferase [Aquincola tertiaricarbonis]
MLTIQPARFPDERDDVVAIFQEYVRSPSVSLDFQDYQQEFATLPGAYASPEGCLLLAREGAAVLGCAAMRRIDATTCEMKRVYVRPAARGKQLGRRLVEAILAEARTAGYARICLDVLPEFVAAQQLYASLGFRSAEAVSFNPVPGTRFLALALQQPEDELLEAMAEIQRGDTVPLDELLTSLPR